jgi:meiotically up-regulated gene 157 (Mug157) protein
MMAVELQRTAAILEKVGKEKLARTFRNRGQIIEAGIWAHGTIKHKVFGEVFAYECDGFGGAIVMDDANLPSLLSLPLLGFLDVSNEVYQNTRRLILDQANPYYFKGKDFRGIGGKFCISSIN